MTARLFVRPRGDTHDSFIKSMPPSAPARVEPTMKVMPSHQSDLAEAAANIAFEQRRHRDRRRNPPIFRWPSSFLPLINQQHGDAHTTQAITTPPVANILARVRTSPPSPPAAAPATDDNGIPFLQSSSSTATL